MKIAIVGGRKVWVADDYVAQPEKTVEKVEPIKEEKPKTVEPVKEKTETKAKKAPANKSRKAGSNK